MQPTVQAPALGDGGESHEIRPWKTTIDMPGAGGIRARSVWGVLYQEKNMFGHLQRSLWLGGSLGMC